MVAEKTVFIVDDHPGARASLTALIESKNLQTESYESAEDFLDHLDVSRDGCVIADVQMKGMSGLDLQNRLNHMSVDIPLIMITAYGDVRTAVEAMQAGAVNFLEKPCLGQELLDSVERAMRTKERKRQTDQQCEEIREQLGTLSESEVEVLDHLMDGLANKQIAARLDIGLRTVELRRSRIMKKLDSNSLADVIRKVMTIRLAD